MPVASLFAARSKPDRARFMRVYLAHVRTKNGVADVAARALPHRDAALDEVPARAETQAGAPVAQIDPEDFARRAAVDGNVDGLSREMLFALAVAKATRGEQFGIDNIPPRADLGDDPTVAVERRTDAQVLGALYLHTELEERTHTRLLGAVVGMLGGVVTPQLPPWAVRIVARTMTRAPEKLAETALLVAEIFGLASFLMLAAEADRIFAHAPRARAAAARLFALIITDEVGHLLFLQNRLGPVRLFVARLCAVPVSRVLMRAFPEALALFGVDACVQAVRSLDVEALAKSHAPELAAAARGNVESSKAALAVSATGARAF